MAPLSTAWAIFQGLLLEALPFLLLGVAISALARWLLPQTGWIRLLPRQPLLVPGAPPPAGLAPTRLRNAALALAVRRWCCSCHAGVSTGTLL